jgi:hypothetical protein
VQVATYAADGRHKDAAFTTPRDVAEVYLLLVRK